MGPHQSTLFRLALGPGLAALPAPADIAEILANIESWMDLAAAEKVGPTVALTLHGLADGVARHRLGDVIARARQKENQQVSELEAVWPAAPKSATMLKGFATQAAYPCGIQRQFGDIDVLVGELRDAWALLRVLVRRGYRFVAAPGVRRVRGGFHAEFEVRRPHDQLEWEINAGGYPVTPYTTVDLDQGGTVRVGGTDVTVAGPESQLVAFAAELVDRPRLLTRDLLDAYMLRRRHGTATVERAVDMARHEGVGEALTVVYRELSELEHGPVTTLSLPGSSGRQGRAAWVPAHRTTALRLSHARRAGGASMLRIAAHRVQDRLRVGGPVAQAFLRAVNDQRDPYRAFARGSVMYLVPLGELSATELDLVEVRKRWPAMELDESEPGLLGYRRDSATVLLTPSGAFLPSLDALVTEGQLRAARELACLLTGLGAAAPTARHSTGAEG